MYIIEEKYSLYDQVISMSHRPVLPLLEVAFSVIDLRSLCNVHERIVSIILDRSIDFET